MQKEAQPHEEEEDSSVLKWTSFFLDMIPSRHTAQAAKKIKKTRSGKLYVGNKHTAKQQNEIRNMYWLLKAERMKLSDPFEGPISLSVIFVYPYLKKVSQKVRKANVMIPKTTRPDCSNIIKGIEDAMTDLGFWKDDAQVQSLNVTKWHGGTPGIHIYIREVKDPE